MIWNAVKGLTHTVERVRLFEKITERLLWKLPLDEIERHLEKPPALPQEAINRARLYTHRNLMLAVVPKSGALAEVGTHTGSFSKVIAETLEPQILHLIDVDFRPFVREWVEGYNVCFHEGDSSTILNRFGPDCLDWLFIDGDHSYEGCRRDLEAGHKALKPGGLMTCNDYTNWCPLAVSPYGVAKAVNELIIRKGYTVEGLAWDPLGNHDLLIRKPQ